VELFSAAFNFYFFLNQQDADGGKLSVAVNVGDGKLT